MRIAIVTETYPPEINGVALTVHHMAQELLSLGHRVMLARPRQAQDASSKTAAGYLEMLLPGSRLPRYPGLRFGWPAQGALRRFWTEHGVEAVYVATEGPLGWSAVKLARALGLPVFTGFHTRFDDFVTHYGARLLVPMAQAWLRRFHNRADATLVPTQALKLELEARGFQRVERLARGVDTKLFQPRRRSTLLRAAWGVGSDRLAVIHVGRLAAEKNLELAVRAFRMIQQQVPDARFIWVGDGPARPALVKANPDFVFCGMQRGEALAEHFASGDLFLFPSLTETYGNVTVEAMASGVAMVAFDYGAAHEHVRDDFNGRVASFADGEQFIAHARQLATSPEHRRLLALRARESVSALSHRGVAEQLAQMMRAGYRQRSAA